MEWMVIWFVSWVSVISLPVTIMLNLEPLTGMEGIILANRWLVEFISINYGLEIMQAPEKW